jgi:hypothetical protein
MDYGRGLVRVLVGLAVVASWALGKNTHPPLLLWLCHRSSISCCASTTTAAMFCDNESVVKNSTRPESMLKKKHNAIAYHRVREAQAARIVAILHIVCWPTSCNTTIQQPPDGTYNISTRDSRMALKIDDNIVRVKAKTLDKSRCRNRYTAEASGLVVEPYP